MLSFESSYGQRRLNNLAGGESNCPAKNRGEAMNDQISRPGSGWGSPPPRARRPAPAVPRSYRGAAASAALHTQKRRAAVPSRGPRISAASTRRRRAPEEIRGQRGVWPSTSSRISPTPGLAVCTGRACERSEGSTLSRDAAAPPLPPHRNGAARRPGPHRKPRAAALLPWPPGSSGCLC